MMLQGAVTTQKARCIGLHNAIQVCPRQKAASVAMLQCPRKNIAIQQTVSRVAILPRAVAAPPTSKRVWVFGPGRSDGDQTMKTLLGGKGANLAQMCKIGLSVPPGFTITTETCKDFHEAGAKLPTGCWEEVKASLAEVESMIGKKMGDKEDPLLVSVRSGAAISMPGMMDTVLNLGLNDEVVEGLAAKAGKRFAYDAYRRFLDMYGDVVMGIPHKLYEARLHNLKQKYNVQEDTELTAEHLQELVQEYKQVYQEQGINFPEEPLEQLENAIYAVFNSWESEKAVLYREYNQISGLAGTAVNVQCMAFGNLGDTSGTGVCFTRNPSTGERLLYGEYLINAQGEDVVAGIRTPYPIKQLKENLPEAYDQLIKNCELLETHYKDMQDIEFTVQEGQLYMLQCRSGKRTGLAAIRIAVEMVDEGLVDVPKAITMVEATHLDQLLHPQFEDEEAYQPFVAGTGLPASPGAAVGRAVFDAETAEERKNAGEKVILVRKETSPEDVKGMYSASGVLCQLGGMTSHAAVVARGWGKTCITGVPGLEVDEDNKTATLGDFTFTEGDYLSLNGTTGEIIKGQQPLKPPTMSGNLGQFMGWVDEHRKLGVLTNADTPEDAATARENGAEGIGLTRTEHMFFKTEDRIKAVRKMILAPDVESRKEALVEIEEFQQADFEGIFKAMDGLPVTIRLLDPPLHEFLPDAEDEEMIQEIANETGLSTEYIETTIENLQEVNPMLGFRGCRLTITYPEIGECQVRAIMQAAVAQAKAGVKVRPDIMIPLVGTTVELGLSESMVRATAKSVMEAAGVNVEYKVGTMIEIPRAGLIADKIAETAEFFSFGTNDLTQMTFGYSRDDIGKFIKGYLDKNILPYDPFIVLDQEGVGKLIEYAVKLGRSTRPNLKVGLCGEQGGEPITVKFLHSIGLDYVSCSPFRVPIARLAAAQAAVTQK